MIIYFSGTRNSEFCAKRLSSALGDECINAGEYMKKDKKGDFISEKPFVFVCPTYAWRIPHIFERFIRESRFDGEKNAYFVMTCGDDAGNAGVFNKKLCTEVHLNYMGTAEVVMPENYIAMFGVPDEEESTDIVKKALPVIENIAGVIARCDYLSEKKANIADKLKSTVVNTAFYALCVRSKDFYVKDSCISCGKCERLCVTNCITMKDGKPRWGEGCSHCMACICSCPVEAIEYGKKSVGKRRYICENIN